MEKGYESFVEKLRLVLLKKTGFKEERIYFKSKDEYPPTSGDRLFLVCKTRGEAQEVCGLYARELYERYLSGASVELLAEEVVRELEKMDKAGFMDKALSMTEYEKVKEDLFIRLINAARNKEDLENAVYHVLGDIALVLYLRIGEVDHSITSAKIKQDVLEGWGREKEQVFQEALLNTYFISPPRIYCWEKLLVNAAYQGENFMDILTDFQIKKDSMGNCLSTTLRTNGAVAVFLPGVAKRLSELLDGSFYMVFTSIHEVMIHNDQCVDPEELRDVLKDTVREATPKEDFLSYYIYHYERETGKFSFE